MATSDWNVPPRSFLDRKNFHHTDPGQPFPWFTQFCGIEMGHNYYLYHVLSRIITGQSGLRAIVELGTGLGALTVYCGLLGIRWRIPVHSLDVKRCFDAGTATLFERLSVQFHELDVFSDAAKSRIAQLARLGPIYLICDNGNKPREFATYVPMLSRGSLISVHDIGCEFEPRDACGPDLMPISADEWFKYNCQFATWQKV